MGRRSSFVKRPWRCVNAALSGCYRWLISRFRARRDNVNVRVDLLDEVEKATAWARFDREDAPVARVGRNLEQLGRLVTLSSFVRTA